MAVLNSTPRYDDLVKGMWHEAHALEKRPVNAASAVAANVSILGYPVVLGATNATIQTAAQVTAFGATSACGVVADDRLVQEAFSAAPSTTRYRTMARGPALVHRDALKTTDPAGAAYDMAKFIAALLVAGIVVVDEAGVTGSL